MKIYSTLEDGTKRYYSSKREAHRNAKKMCRLYEENTGDYGMSLDGCECEEIPTNKKELIVWLNKNAYYTGYTPAH